ncbi:MAG TPA: hypothetical protein GX708_14920 [Gallicola sp.]|nr:hypothetical protein [Gallicola sp.]
MARGKKVNNGEETVKFIDDINKLYKETQEMTRLELVKMIYDLQNENKELDNWLIEKGLKTKTTKELE